MLWREKEEQITNEPRDSRGYVDVTNFITNLWNLIEILEF